MESAYYDRLRCRLHLLSYELCKQSMQQVLKYMFIYVCVCVWRCIYIHDLQAAVSSGPEGVQKVCPLCLCSCFTAAAICHKLKPNSVSFIYIYRIYSYIICTYLLVNTKENSLVICLRRAHTVNYRRKGKRKRKKYSNSKSNLNLNSVRDSHTRCV